MIEHWRNLSLINIVEEIDGILYEGTMEGHRWIILKQCLLKSGYLKVGLSYNGVNSTRSVHRLVSKAFLKNIKNKPEVNHIHGIKMDNRVHKLEWSTSSENAQHKFNTGLATPAWLGKKGKYHHSSKTVIQYDKNMNFIKKWDSVTEASASVGACIHSSLISSCCLGLSRIVKGRPYKTKSAFGYIWKYV